MPREEITVAGQTNARSGLDALLAVRPRWLGLVPALQRIERDGRWLLHAGAPFADACNPPAPIVSSAVLA